MSRKDLIRASWGSNEINITKYYQTKILYFYLKKRDLVNDRLRASWSELPELERSIHRVKHVLLKYAYIYKLFGNKKNFQKLPRIVPLVEGDLFSIRVADLVYPIMRGKDGNSEPFFVLRGKLKSYPERIHAFAKIFYYDLQQRDWYVCTSYFGRGFDDEWSYKTIIVTKNGPEENNYTYYKNLIEKRELPGRWITSSIDSN